MVIALYLALYRKYRPRRFDDVVGQPHITMTLKNEVLNNRTAHAYLFTGSRGTGKTTCSKILAMAVNCQNPIDGNPCLSCESCKAIEEGSTLDVVEIDAASNNGVDNIRDLRDEASYTPVQCKYRVYIIDETHMLSTGAFNALLKIMEEPPEHVKFILATTEAHKVPATILSRCQRFDFHRIKSEDIKQRLQFISTDEPFTLEEDAATLIARLADGGMRDACSILDRCIAFSDKVDLECVSKAAGIAGREYLFELTDCFVENDPSRAVMLIDKLYSMSKDLQGLVSELIHHLRNVMLAATLVDTGELIPVMPEELEKIKSYTTKIPLEGLLSAISLLQDCLDKMAKSGDKRLTLELCLIKLCTPSMNVDNDAILARLSRLEAAVSAISTGTATAVAPRAANTVTTSDAAESEFTEVEKTAQKAEKANEKPTAIKEEALSKSEEQVLTEPKEAFVRSEKTEPALPLDDGEIRPLLQWAEVLSELSKTNAPLFAVLENGEAFIGGEFLYIETKSAFASAIMKQESNAARLIRTVEDKTGIKYKLRMKASAETETPSMQADMLSDILKKAKSSGIEVSEG